MKIGIHQNERVFEHSTNWRHAWIQYCEERSLQYEVVDFFDSTVRERFKEFDILLWHLTHYSWQEMQFARSILHAAATEGISTFPDFPTSWHFDDKVGQMFLFDAQRTPAPHAWLFTTEEDFEAWLDTRPTFPVVAKLRGGSGSHNVRLLESPKQARSYAETMFRRGMNQAPHAGFKTISNLRSAKNIATVISRAKRAPEFFRTRSKAKAFGRDHGYVYLQEFIPNPGYDLKVVTVGDKASFIVRHVRPNDFRASGGGNISYDRNLLDDRILQTAFRTSRQLGVQCMGYDFVIDSRTSEPVIIEMSFGFSHEAVLKAGGYWSPDGAWHESPLNVPHEVLSNLVYLRDHRSP